jgi:hypothetical protein
MHVRKLITKVITPSEQEVWLRAWSQVASAINCHEPSDATRWADNCLADFRERFPAKSKSEGPIQPI